MFLGVTRQRNPQLIEAAATLHREGVIGPDTFVLDIDRIVENARINASAAREAGIRLYAMTKQAGRNPFMARAAIEGGIPAAVAVDTPEARILHRHDIPIGHVGHLVQVPLSSVEGVLAMQPEVVTVFSLEAAQVVARAAAECGVVQPLLLRILEEGDFAYAGQEGGFRLSDLPAAVQAVGDIRGVTIAGVTAFPCLLFDYEKKEIEMTPNFDSLLRAAACLRDIGVAVEQINAPSVTCAATIPILAERGATHGEPGSALIGNTPLHAYTDQPETPAMVYVSEVSGVDGDVAYCYGGGFYARSRVAHALLVGRKTSEVTEVEVRPLPPDAIDYYATLMLPPGAVAHVGDTVVCAFRSQVFVSRSQVATVGGLSRGGRDLLGVCDAHGNLLEGEGLPVDAQEAHDLVAQVWNRFRARLP